MRILLLGSGGREHALAWAISASPLCSELICVPGNAGMRKIARCIWTDIMDNESVTSLCQHLEVDLVVVDAEPTERLRKAWVDCGCRWLVA